MMIYGCLSWVQSSAGECCIPLVYMDEGRIVYMRAADGEAAYVASERYMPEDIERNALIQIEECFPGVQIIEEHDLAAQYDRDGWRAPTLGDLGTDMLCACGAQLRLNSSSRFAGRNTPMGNPWHIYYHCSACALAYQCISTETSDGVISTWKKREYSGNWQEMDEPPAWNHVNTHGFRETILYKKEGQS